MELRSADPTANPYLAFALLLSAGLCGIENRLNPPKSADYNLYTASAETLCGYRQLPISLEEAMKAEAESNFIRHHLPKDVIDAYCNR